MQANWKRISSLILVFAIVFTTLFNGVSIETVKAAASATTIDVTNLDAGATYTHDCSKYAVNKYDATYHWKACSVCGKVIAGTKAKHSLKDNGWTMGSAALCSGSNHHVYTCSCGYSKNDDTGRAKHTYNTPCNCWGRHTHYHCTVCGSTDYQSGMSRTENCIEAAKKAGINVDCFTSFTCPTCGAKYVKDKSTKTWNIYNIDWKNGGKTATHKTYEPNANAWNFAHNRTARFGTAVSDGYLETDNDGVWCQDCGLKLIKNQESNYQIVNGEGVFTTTFVLPDNAELFSTWCNTTFYGTSGKYYSMDTNKQFKLKTSDGKDFISKGTNFTKIDAHTVKITSYIKLPTAHTEVPEKIYHEFQYKINGYRYRAISCCKYDDRGDGVQRFHIVPETEAPKITSATVTPVYLNGEEEWATGVKLSFAGTENYCNTVTLKIRDAKGNVIKTVKTNVSNKKWAYNASLNLEGSTTGVNYTVEAEDNLYNISEKKTFTVKKTDAKAPTVTSSAKTGTDWSKTKSWTASATDDGVGGVSIAFHKTSDKDDKAYTKAAVNGSSYSTNYIFTGDVYGSKSINVVYKDRLGNETSKAVTISNLDNTAPTITNASTVYSENNEIHEVKTNVKVAANDEKDFNGTKKSGSGIAGYAISTTNTVPSKFQTSNTFSVTKSGTYYVFAKDNAGNVSTGKKVNVNVKRKVTFNYNKPVADSTLTGNETAYKYVAYNTVYGTLPAPGLLGYTFNGWYTGSTTGTQITSKSAYTSDSDTTAYARWTLNNYSITYNLNADDATISGQPTSYNVNMNSFTLPKPVRKGYTFTGWTGSNGTDSALTVTIPKGSTGNKSYKAHWRSNKLIVTYNKNGGIIDKSMSNYSQDINGFSQEWQYNHVNANGGTTEDPINFSSFGLKRKDGYVRRDGAEWNTKSDGTGRSYDQDKHYTMTQFAPELEKGDVNLVLYAQWQPAEYSITYDLKGGSLSNQKTSYNVETASFTIPQPTKNGYTFTGWTGSNGTTPQTSVTVAKGSMGNKSYTANWSPIKYSITYNLNGGSLSGQKTEYNIETETFTIPQPTKKGYTFLGWTGSNGSTAQKSVTVKQGSTGNKAYTANWSKNSYNLKVIGLLDKTYDANVTGYGTFDVYIDGVQAANDCSFYSRSIPYGSKWEIKDIRATTGHYYNGVHSGSAAGTMDDKDATVALDFSTKKTVVTFYRNYNSSDTINASQTFVYGSPNQAFTNKGWTRYGYTLIGWSEDRNAASKTYDITNPVSNGWILSKTDKASSNVSLYAVWQRNTYSISYDLKGGSISNAPASYNVETETFTIPQPTKNGYTFTGWTGSNGTTPNTSVTIQKGSTGNKSYTANWAPITYSITYDLKGGTANNLVKSYNIETASFSIPQPIKDGYIFTGWSGTGIQGSSKNVTVNQGSTGNRAYTANWTPVNYGITYNLNGGTASGLKTSYTVETASFALAIPVKPGYTFTGWTGSNGATPQTNVVIAQGSKGNRSYTANWNKIDYSITYDLQGGKIDNAPTSYNVETAAFHIPQPTKNGYTFTGWTGTDLSGLTKDVIVNKGSVGNRHYKANWQVITYSVTYNLDGGSISGQPTKYTVESTALNIPRPTKTGYTFLGWTGSNGSTNQLDVIIAHGSTGNKNYTAHWKVNTYTMTVNHCKYNQRTGQWDIFKVTKDKADYGTVYTPKYDTPTGYYNHHRDWDKGWTVTGDGSFSVYYYPNSYKLDVNTWLDGVKGSNGGGYPDIKFNVYVNNKLTAQNVSDYCASHLYSDTYKIEMIANSKYTYEKQAYEGTIKDNVLVEPKAQAVPMVERIICTQNGNDDFYAYTYVSGLGSLDRVVFPSWTDEAGQDDLNPHWQSGEKADEKGNWTINGQTYNYRKLIKSANHRVSGRDEHNWYNVHIYAYNGYGGKTVKTATFAFQYNVGFNYNKPLNAAGTMNNASEGTRTVVYNTAYGTLPKPSMTGWTFNGWYTTASGGNKVEGTDAYKYVYGTTLYAHWTANRYTVNFNYNKPSNASSNITNCNTANKSVTYDSAYGTLPEPSLNGWKFEGWYTSANKRVISSDIYRIAGNQTLSAHWSAIENVVTFDYNKPATATSAITDNSVTKKTVYYDSPYGTLPTPRLKGWTFNGWYTDDNVRVSENTVFRSLTAQTLHAHWTANAYRVNFDYNKPSNASGTIERNNVTSKNVTYDSVYGDLPNPVLTGWQFDGWYTERTGGRLISKTTIYNIVAGNQMLYAHWTANTYTISFNKNQPSKASRTVLGTMNQIRYTYDSDNQKLPVNKYSLTGWEFIGWRTSANGTGKLYADMDSIRNITSTNGANITMYAQWKQKTYTITFVYQDNKTQNTKRSVMFDSNLSNTINPPTRTGYDFDYWCVKNNDREGIHVYNNKGRWIDENSHTFWSKDGNWNHEGDITVYAHWTDRKTPQNTYLRAVSGNEICGTAGEIEAGQKPTEVTPVMAKVTTYLQKPSMISALAATLEGADRNNVLNGWQTEWFNFKDKNGNEKPVTLVLHSEDDGSGIANLSIIDSTNNAVFKTQNFNNTATGNISKDYISSQEAHFNGKAVDKAGNSTNTTNLIIKGDRSMPYAASYSDGSTGFVLMTGTLDNPIGKQDNEYNGSCRFGHEIQNNLDSSLKNTDGVVTGVNDDGMRTEILAKVKDNGSGVKYVWAVVSGREGTKIYPCRRSNKDKDVYVAVNGADHGSDKGKLPNLYTDFKQSTELSVYMFACDEAGNVAQIHAKDGNGVVTNFSMYNQIIRDDRNFPSIHFTASGYGPYFLLGQSGNIHIVTYGYVDSVDIEFPAELQAAALADKANSNLSAKVLGTKRMVKDADIGNRIQLLNSTTQNSCTRITDYAFVVPLSLNSDTVKTFMVNPEADADGNYNALPASGNFKLKNIAPDGTVSYDAAFCLSGNGQAYAITTETAYKNSDTLIHKAYFKCGSSESGTDDGESITQKIHTHLVN